ncbi:MFS transporter [Chloroflexota bacterium]
MEEVPTGAEPSSFLAAIRSGETFRALRNRNFRLLWIGMVGHSASLWVEAVARSWLIWELTGSATLLAVVNMLRVLPMLGFGLLAGVAADRFDKRKILIICQTFTLLNKVVLAVLIIIGAVEVWHVLLTAFLMGCSMAFNQPTRMSLVPGLVGEGELTNAVALNSAAMNVTRILGPAAAGLLIAPLGIGGVYFASAGVYVITLIATIMLRVPSVITRMKRTSVWTDLGETFRYIYGEKSILSLVLLALVPMTLGMPYMTLMPIFADQVLDIGASGFGLLYSAVGVGAFLAVMTIATLGRIHHKGLIILLGVFGFGAFLAVFSQSTWVPLSLVIMAFVGFASTGSMVLINTGLLEIAPPEMRGRVMSVYMLDRGLMPLGTMIVGPLADVIGAPPTLLIMGSVCALLALSMGIGVPFVRRIP